MGLILWSFLFYVFGIIGWFVPYLLLALILLIWSFRSGAEVLMRVFAFAPVAMAVLILALVNLLSLGSQDLSALRLDATTNIEYFLGVNLGFALLTLLWGYICVGIGFGIYKILQRFEFIKDEAMTTPVPLAEPL